MKITHALPRQWRHLVFVLSGLQDRLPGRLVHKIERLNRRMAVLDAQRGPS